MNNLVESKWGWIARLCRERGYEKAEQLAYKIDTALILLYGPSNSVDWAKKEEDLRTKNEGKSVTDMEIYDIANSPNIVLPVRFKKLLTDAKGADSVKHTVHVMIRIHCLGNF